MVNYAQEIKALLWKLNHFFFWNFYNSDNEAKVKTQLLLDKIALAGPRYEKEKSIIDGDSTIVLT